MPASVCVSGYVCAPVDLPLSVLCVRDIHIAPDVELHRRLAAMLEP